MTFKIKEGVAIAGTQFADADRNVTAKSVAVSATTTSTSTSTGAITVAGGVGISENLNVGGNFVVTGDLTVNGTTTNINTTNLIVEDKNIIIADVATPTDITADGGGITLKGSTDKTLSWIDATDAWTSSEHLNLASAKAFYIDGTSVLNATTLGSGVTGSSLTSVGTIGTGSWQGSVIGSTYGGTGVNNGTKTITLGGSFTTSGAHNTTLTTTDNTTLTLPSTGTLATTGNLSQFAATTSAQLAGVISDETGSGALVFATSPTLVTPTLGVASATSVNKVVLTVPATSATLTIADGKTITVSNTLTFTGTDTSTIAFTTGGTVAYTTAKLSQFGATTSAELAGVVSDDTGSGSLVFATSPTLVTPTVAIVNGSTAAAGTLTLRSTTSATKPTAGILIDETIASTTTATGALVVSGGLGVGGVLSVNKLYLEGSREKISPLTGATGTVVHNTANASVFYHTVPVADFSVNFTNVPTTDNLSIVYVVIIAQGTSPYVPSSISIDGIAQTVLWLGSFPGYGTPDNTDVFSFILLRSSSTWTVMANFASYGAVV